MTNTTEDLLGGVLSNDNSENVDYFNPRDNSSSQPAAFGDFTAAFPNDSNKKRFSTWLFCVYVCVYGGVFILHLFSKYIII